MDSIDEIQRSELSLLILENATEWRSYQERTLKRAGFGHVTSLPALSTKFSEHYSSAKNNWPSVIIFGVQPQSDLSWENFRTVRAAFSGPTIATTVKLDDAARKKALELGASGYVPLVDSGEDGLPLKLDTIFSCYRVDNLLKDNDQRIQRMFLNILTVMVKILESKDPYTRFHSHSVAMWSRNIGRKKGLTEEELIRLGLSGLFHDFGKIGIPEEILNKPSRLTDEEFEIMKQHPVIGRKLLSSLELFSDLLPGITHHHERWDGRGYPSGLVGDQTPLWARIICLADAYDTMVSRRTYKSPMSEERVMEELTKGKGTQFDPELVDFMLEILKEKKAAAQASNTPVPNTTPRPPSSVSAQAS